MPVLDEGTLREQALDDCRTHAEATLDGDLDVEVVESELAWDPVALRHVFDQSHLVWRRFAQFEVVVDGAGRPLGFIDGGGWEECEDAPLDLEDALELARQSGWFTPELEAAGGLVEGELGSRILDVEDRGRPPGRRRFTIEVNPKRRVLISVLPGDFGSDGS